MSSFRPLLACNKCGYVNSLGFGGRSRIMEMVKAVIIFNVSGLSLYWSLTIVIQRHSFAYIRDVEWMRSFGPQLA